MANITELDFQVAGVTFRPGYPDNLKSMMDEALSLAVTQNPETDLDELDDITFPIKLVAEPTNKFDRNAIMVYMAEKHIGYVPKEIAADLIRKLIHSKFRYKAVGKILINAQHSNRPGVRAYVDYWKAD